MIDAASSATELTKSSASKQKLAEDLDQFMNLLVTQLQHQDPLDPMDPNEFTSQLVQFAGVEQQIQANSNLERMVEIQQSSLLGSLVGYIGKQVEVLGNEMSLDANGELHANYALAAKATTTTITITDDTGKSVYSTSGQTDAGRHAFHWNGKNTEGFSVPDGTYTITVSALDSEENPIEVAHSVTGLVTGVASDSGTPILSFKDTNYLTDAIISVVEKPASSSEDTTGGS